MLMLCRCVCSNHCPYSLCQVPDLDVIVCSVSGGGFMAGVAVAAKVGVV